MPPRLQSKHTRALLTSLSTPGGLPGEVCGSVVWLCRHFVILTILPAKKRQDEIGDQIRDRVGSSCVNMLMRLCDRFREGPVEKLLGTPSDKNDEKNKSSFLKNNIQMPTSPFSPPLWSFWFLFLTVISHNSSVRP